MTNNLEFLKSRLSFLNILQSQKILNEKILKNTFIFIIILFLFSAVKGVNLYLIDTKYKRVCDLKEESKKI